MTNNLSRNTGSPSFPSGLHALNLVLLIFFSWVCKFENFAEIKFFTGNVIPFAGVPFTIYNKVYPIEDRYDVLPCGELGNSKLLRTTLNPLLFKGCIVAPHNLTVEKDFATFPKSITNIFPPCGKTNRINRTFSFQAVSGEMKLIVEEVPCASTTLEEKIRFHQAHDPTRDGPHSDVHVRHLSSQEKLALEKDFKTKGILPDSFSFSKVGQVVGLAHFFGSGTTPVDYFHGHLDRFFSFGIQTTKVWDLINPKYYDHFEYRWSGIATILTKEKQTIAPAPHVTIDQEPGDILFLPPWWLHKTSYKDKAWTKKTKNVNFNLHTANRRSFVGISAELFMNLVGKSTWFYDINRKAYESKGRD